MHRLSEIASARKHRMTNKGKSARAPSDAPYTILADLDRERAFRAIADYFERLQRPTISQAVSIARALRPLAEQEGRRRQAHGGTAPGRSPRKQRGVGFDTRGFIARCVGLAPATLRKAERVVEAAEQNPCWRNYVRWMDQTGKVGPAFHAVTVRPIPCGLSRSYRQAPADRKFGELLVHELLGAAGDRR